MRARKKHLTLVYKLGESRYDGCRWSEESPFGTLYGVFYKRTQVVGGDFLLDGEGPKIELTEGFNENLENCCEKDGIGLCGARVFIGKRSEKKRIFKAPQGVLRLRDVKDVNWEILLEIKVKGEKDKIMNFVGQMSGIGYPKLVFERGLLRLGKKRSEVEEEFAGAKEIEENSLLYDLVLRFLKMEQELPSQLDKALSEFDAPFALRARSVLEARLGEVVRKLEIKSYDDAGKAMQFLDYANSCGVYTKDSEELLKKKVVAARKKLKKFEDEI